MRAIFDFNLGITTLPLTKMRKSVLESIPEFAAPFNLVAPSISGIPQEGETLAAQKGSWDSGGSAVSFSYQWFRGNDLVEGATSQTYMVNEPDIDNTIKVEVVATNSVGQSAAISDPTGVVIPAATAPVNTILPTITGVARSGEILALNSNGTWTGNGDEILDYEYQWLADNIEMPGETGTTVSLTDSEIGQKISMQVTAINSIGETIAVSLQTAAVVAAQYEPGIVAAPNITGRVKVGYTLTVSDGTWNNGGTEISSYTYRWFADDVEIDGETTNSLDLLETWESQEITAAVTATNAIGSIEAFTEPTDAVEAEFIAPVNTAIPVVSGLARAGETLTCSEGTWYDGGDMPTFTYQWFLQSTGELIPGETANTIDLVEEQIDDRVRCQVTATNLVDGTSIYTAYSPLIGTPAAPENSALPVVSGILYVGEILSTTNGTWDSFGFDIEYSYQWYAGNQKIDDATSSTFTLTDDQFGLQINVLVIATTLGGTSGIKSSLTDQVSYEPLPPENTGLPVISGEAYLDFTLNASNGTWDDNHYSISGYSYKWYSDAVEIDGATDSYYTVQGADDGLEITVEVTATNENGSVTATSTIFGPIDGYKPLPPENTVLPKISGDFVAIDITLSADAGEWDDKHFTISGYAYRWFADDVEIVGATSNSFAPTEAQLGAVLTAEVSATNSNGTIAALSLDTVPVGKSPIYRDLEFDYSVLESVNISKNFVFDYAILAPMVLTKDLVIDYAILN